MVLVAIVIIYCLYCLLLMCCVHEHVHVQYVHIIVTLLFCFGFGFLTRRTTDQSMYQPPIAHDTRKRSLCLFLSMMLITMIR